jgi:hypothetical protein
MLLFAVLFITTGIVLFLAYRFGMQKTGQFPNHRGSVPARHHGGAWWVKTHASQFDTPPTRRDPWQSK